MASIVTGTVACGKNQKECEKQALEMLETKYGEKFVVQEYLGQESLEGYFKVSCYPEMDMHILFEAKVACDSSYIEDGYISAVICDKVENQIDENLEHLEGYLVEKVVPVSRSVDSNNPDMDVEEFMALKTKNRFAVYLMYCPQEKDVSKVYKEIQKTFQRLECLSGNIQLYIMQEEALKEVQEYFAETIEPESGFEKITEGAKRITIPFKAGVIQMSEEEFTKEAGGMV